MADIVADAQKKLRKVRYEMSRKKNRKRCGFLMYLHMQMRVQITESVPLAATDGIHVKYNPNFILDKDVEHLMFAAMHEAGHVLMEHIPIAKEKDLDLWLWNIAGDHAINLWLLEAGFPEAACGDYFCDPKYKGWSTMEIYKDLQQDPPDKDDPRCMHDVQAPSEETQEQASQQGNNIGEVIRGNIAKAVTQARMDNSWGNVPGEIRRKIEDIIHPKLPWDSILRKYMTARAKFDFSMNRPNRRFLHEDLYLPSMDSPHIGGITFGTDVSGSMNDHIISSVFSELAWFWRQFSPEWMRIMTFDTQIHMDERFEAGETLRVPPITGGGGTNVNPFLDTVREDCPAIAVVLTDGMFGTPDYSGIRSDIIWIITDNGEHMCFDPRPRDKVIYFDLE